jgi:hypothetical protein
MRVYNFRGQDIILIYRVFNEGIEVSTVIYGTIISELYNTPNLLNGYNEVNDLIDDLSLKFIRMVKDRLGENSNE